MLIAKYIQCRSLTLSIPLTFDFVPLHMYKSLLYRLSILAAAGIARISLLLLLHRERFAARYAAGLGKNPYM